MIKRGVLCFVGGALRAVDLDKNGYPVDSSNVAVSGQEAIKTNALDAADKISGPTRDEIREELRKRGIPFKATMNKADLSALLVSGGESVAEKETTGEATPDEGTGNQEVI